MTFNDFLLVPNAYVFTGLFGFILMAYILFHMVTVQQKSAATWGFIGFYGGLLLSYLCTFFLNAAPQSLPMLAPFQDTLVLLGAVGLAYFAYGFPTFDQPREARWVTSLFGVVAFVALSYSSWYAYQCFTLPQPPEVNPYFWLLVPVMTAIGLLLFARRMVHFARQEPGWTWRKIFSILWSHPTQPAVLAHRDFTLAMSIALSQGVFAFLDAFPQVFPINPKYIEYGLNLSMLISVAVLALVYFNRAPHPITFMVKLVGATLVLVFALFGILAIEIGDYITTQYQTDQALLVDGAQRAIANHNLSVLPPAVTYIISRPATAVLDSTYQLEYGALLSPDPWDIPRQELPEQKTAFQFTLNDRQYQVGLNNAQNNQQVRQIMLRLLLFMTLASVGIIVGLPFFFQILLVGPIKTLLAGVEQVKRGNLDLALPIQYEDELGTLTNAFNQMAHALRQAGEERVQLTAQLAQKELFRSMFETHSAVMLLIDPENGQIVQGNQAAANYYGYPLAQLQTMSVYTLNQLPHAEVAQALAQAKTARRNDFEFQHRLASGIIREVEIHATPVAAPPRR